MTAPGSWLICQIGAREHYAIPRALHRQGQLHRLLTDFWIPPGHAFGVIPGGRRLRDRFHPDLVHAPVWAPNGRMLAFESIERLRKRDAWSVMVARNHWFQRNAISHLRKISRTIPKDQTPTLFSYSYAALELFRFAKSRGWKTVLGQIDPGPEEERIVAAEHRRYSHLKTSWQPSPTAYWDGWREEIALADRIIVNSHWSQSCLEKEGVAAGKMEIVPLVYDSREIIAPVPHHLEQAVATPDISPPLRVLFLGQINLRKGVGRLLDAMRSLKDEAIQLTMVGPTEIDPSAWADLGNVRFPGSVPRSEVAELYDQADLFILPTLSDGYALTQLEALSRGLPLLVSRHCGDAVTPEVNGWLLDDTTPEAIATQLRRLAQAPAEIRKASAMAATSIRFDLDGLGRALQCGDSVTPS